MLNSIRSRSTPAGQTTPSMEPQLSQAAATTSAPTSKRDTSPARATAVPPAAVISSTVASATSAEGFDPSRDTP